MLNTYDSNFKSNTNIQWHQIQLEYWTVSGCVAGTQHKSVPESEATWPYASIFLLTFWPNHENDFLQLPNVNLTYAHTRLQNKIIYIHVKNKIKKTNSRKTLYDLRMLRGVQSLP